MGSSSESFRAIVDDYIPGEGLPCGVDLTVTLALRSGRPFARSRSAFALRIANPPGDPVERLVVLDATGTVRLD